MKTFSDLKFGDKVWVVAGDIIEDAIIIELSNKELVIKNPNNDWLKNGVRFDVSSAKDDATYVCKLSHTDISGVFCFFNLKEVTEHLKEKVESLREKANNIENKIEKWINSTKIIHRNFVYNNILIEGTTERERLGYFENVYTITNPEVLEQLNIRIFDPSDPYKFKIDELSIDCWDKEYSEDGYLMFSSEYKRCIFKKEGDEIKMYCEAISRCFYNF